MEATELTWADQISLRARREDIKRLVQLKFGRVAPEVGALIEGVDSEEAAGQLFDRVFAVQTESDLLQAAQCFVRMEAEVVLELRIGVPEHADVRAGAEEFLARAAEHDDVDRAVHPRVEDRRIDLAHHLVRVRVRGRIVQLDRGDAVRDGITDFGIRHKLSTTEDTVDTEINGTQSVTPQSTRRAA